MKNTRTTYFDGKKSVDIWGDNPAGWTIFSGDDSARTDQDYFKFIPTLYRAVQLRAYSISTMPFQVLKGKEAYDTSADWENKVGFMPNPFTILQLIESALVMAGSCYLFRERSVAATKALHYHLPNSVTPSINKQTGKVDYFIRPVDGVQKHFKPEDYVYFWMPDPYVEVRSSEELPRQGGG